MAGKAGVGGVGAAASKSANLTSGEHAAKFAELAQREAEKMTAALSALRLAASEQPRDVVAEKQASTANGGLETSTFTVAARVRPLSDAERRSDGGHAFACVTPAGPGKSKYAEEAAVLTPKLSLKGVPTLEKSNFAFDKFFPADADDDDVYATLGRPLVGAVQPEPV